MGNLSEYIIILSYMVFLSYSPGPNNILCSINGTKYGWKKTIPLITGMITGFFLVGFFTSLTVEVIKEQQEILETMKYFCCLYLLYRSYMIITDDPQKCRNDAEALESPMQFTNGFVLQFINGKVIFYYIILMTVYASRLGSEYPVKFGLLLGASFVGLTAVSTWTIIGVFLRKYLSNLGRARQLNYILGFLLSLVAIDLAFHDDILAFF